MPVCASRPASGPPATATATENLTHNPQNNPQNNNPHDDLNNPHDAIEDAEEHEHECIPQQEPDFQNVKSGGSPNPVLDSAMSQGIRPVAQFHDDAQWRIDYPFGKNPFFTAMIPSHCRIRLSSFSLASLTLGELMSATAPPQMAGKHKNRIVRALWFIVVLVFAARVAS
jgi:hypothetical protein